MATVEFLRTSWCGPWIIAALCVLVLIPMMPDKAEATAVEYAVFLALIIVICITPIVDRGESWDVLGKQLQNAAQAAQDANTSGEQHKEASRLAKTIGAAEGMMGLLTSCDDTCIDTDNVGKGFADVDELRNALQRVIGTASLLKARALAGGGTCNPDGVIRPTEQCDPLATPTGCPITTERSFCNDECECQVSTFSPLR